MRRLSAALLVALAACGGASSSGRDGVQDSGRSSRPGESPTAGASESTLSTGESPPPGVAPGGGVSPTAKASTASVTATLAESCVPRGETQTMTVAGLKAGEVTGYSTQYSDGSNELTNKKYTSGYGSGVAGPDGRSRSTWVVPAAAPDGRAEVLVIWASGKEPLRVSFTIPGEGQRC